MTARAVHFLAGLLSAALLAGGALAVEGDVVMKRKDAGGGIPPALFPHWIHRIRYRCYACHDSLFKMVAGANTVTMAEISQGKSCGACHDGVTAWGSSYETCNRCHVAK